MERVVVFIDGSNLYRAFQKVYGAGNYNLVKLAEILTGKERTLSKVHYYVGKIKQEGNKQLYTDQQRFFNYWRTHPLCELRLGRVVKSGGTWKEKGVDVMLAADLLLLAMDDQYDTAVIVSADGDFVPVIEAVQVRFRKRVENAMPPEFKGMAISRACNKYIPIDGKTFNVIAMHLK